MTILSLNTTNVAELILRTKNDQRNVFCLQTDVTIINIHIQRSSNTTTHLSYITRIITNFPSHK